MAQYRVFDGHNDLLYRMHTAGKRRADLWLKGQGAHHLDLPRMQAVGFAGGFFAIWVPSQTDNSGLDFEKMMANPPYRLPLPEVVTQCDALPVAMDMAACLYEMERQSDGAFRVCLTGAEVRAAVDQGVIAAIMHMEGAEALGEDLSHLHAWHKMGLRSLGPVWSRPTVFGDGVPFAFPASPDIGSGLTDLGKELVRECDALRIMIDLSHLNEKGFDDVAAISSRPLVATHSNVHAISASSRNLTDRQLHVIAESGGMVGLNFGCGFLRPDGQRRSEVPNDIIMRHLDHLLNILGENGVALGSDFDGALMPDVIRDVSGLPALCDAMAAHGYGDALVKRIAAENWLDFVGRAF